MKIVAILGSPRGMSGNTGLLLDGVIHGARDAGAEVQLFSLANYDVQPCRGCEACHISGECPIADNFAALLAAVTAADGLVLASPNYILSVTAQLKAFLDRLSGPIHLQTFTGKYAAAVVTAGGPGSDEVEQYLLRALRMTGCATVGSVGAMGWQMTQDATRAPHLTNAAALGVALVAAIRDGQRFPAQDLERLAVRTRMRQLVMAQKEHWPYEYAIWAGRDDT